MATYDEVMSALRKADASGNTEDAKRLSQMATKLKSDVPTKENLEKTSKPKDEPGLIDKAEGGIEVGLNIGTGALGSVAGGFSGLLKGVTGGKYGTSEGANEAEQEAVDVAQDLTYQPRTATGQEYVGDISDAFNASKLGGLNPYQAMELGASSIPAQPAARAMASKTAPVAKAIGQGVKAVGRALVPKLDPETVALGNKAAAMGITVTPDMLVDNKFVRLLGQASRDVPLSGAKTDANKVAFNRAIIGAFGGDVKEEKITPKVYEQAMKKNGGIIGAISEKYPVQVAGDLQTKLDGHVINAAQYETADVGKVIKSYVDEIQSKAGNTGIVDGTTMRKIRTKLTDQMRRTTNPDLKHALSELDDDLLDSVQKNLSKTELAVFNKARYYYKNGKTVEPLIAKAASKGQGNMSPAALANQVTSTKSKKADVAMGRGGDLADISAVGSRFMTEPSSSMTAERGLVYSGLGGLGYVDPLLATGIYGGANLYNRVSPAFARLLLSTQK